MGTFVSVYDFLGYRLTTAPFHCSQSGVGGIFLLYFLRRLFRLVRARSSRVRAALGRSSAARCSSRTLYRLLRCFGVGASVNADRAEASGTYLACYYLGSSIVGYLVGFVFHYFGRFIVTL